MNKLLKALLPVAIAAGLLVAAPQVAYAGGYDPEVTCTSAGFGTGRALSSGDHINLDIVQDGRKFQLNAYVDRNIQGGHDTLGIRINGHAPIPLTEGQVKAGALVFDYAKYLPSKAAYSVEWVQFNSSYFNQDRNPAKFLHCPGEPPVIPVAPAPEPVTTVKDEETVNCATRTVTKTTTTTVQDWVLVDNKWQPAEPVVTVTTQDRAATETECELPEVGVNTASLLWTLGGGLALVGAGVVLRRKRKVS